MKDWKELGLKGPPDDPEVLAILAKNKEITKRQNELIQEAHALTKAVKPPCEWCRFDGEFRCEACSSNNYEGFNIRDYPSYDVEFVPDAYEE